MSAYQSYHSDDDTSSLIINNSTGTASRATVSDDESGSYRRRQRARPRTGVAATGAASGWHSLDEYSVTRDEAMMEGSRMLIDSLKEKVAELENRCVKLEREKGALGDLLGARKRELLDQEEDFEREINAFEDRCETLESENRRLVDRMKLPEGQKFNLIETEKKISGLERQLTLSGNQCKNISEENVVLRQEICDLRLEMDEMHDQFREDEAQEFREIQKDLEATAKNCRILQFKLRKAERRNEQQEVDKIRYEEKIRQLEGRFDSLDDRQQHVRELEEELKMAKEVSVRLHDELEHVEEQRIAHEQEKSRLQNYIDDSESRRAALQKESDDLHKQLENLSEKLRESRNSTGDTPRRKSISGDSPKLSSKDLSILKNNANVEQLMRELSDSLERENDIQEQFRFAEEEIVMMRKKLSEVEQENESLDAQLHKMSSAKSSRFSPVPNRDNVVTEREHDLKIEIELAEEEVKILKRKFDELERENEKLIAEVEFLQDIVLKRSSGPPTGPAPPTQPGGVDERTDEEKIQAMASDIDDLKWKLMEKERLAERFARKDRDTKKKRSFLQKSRSLDDEHNVDLQKQLDLVQQEAALLRERLSRLETENDKLSAENRTLNMLAGRKGSAKSSDSKDDRIKELENENSALLLRVNQDNPDTPTGDVTGPRDFKQRLRLAEEENVSLRRKMAAAESTAERLRQELSKIEDENRRERDEQLAQEQRLKILDLEREIKDLLNIVKNREEENGRLEEEIDEYKEDMDKMVDVFRIREADIMEEIESVHQKNNVLSNLLDLVTERAETTQKELERITHDTSITSSQRSDRSCSVVSAASDISLGSDEVFLSTSAESREKERKGINKDWEDQFVKRINCLERLLVEERLKVHAAEKRETFKDIAPSITMDDTGLHSREKEILRKELAVCERQLNDANEQIGDLKDRLEQFEDAHDVIKKDFEKVCSELDSERARKGSDSAPATPPTSKLNKSGRSSSLGSLSGREPASWRWEKQEYERQLREMKKKTDELHRQVQRAQIKFKMAGGDEKAKAEKEKLEKDLKATKEECITYKSEMTELNKNIKQLQESLTSKQAQWAKDRGLLETQRRAAEKEATQKNNIVNEKDAIIGHKDDLIKEKEQLLAEQQSMVDRVEHDKKKYTAEINQKDKSLQQAEKSAEQLRNQIVQKEDAVKEKEKRIRDLDERLRGRDQRLKEKDEIMERLNKNISDKTSELNEAKTKYNETLKKLHENEAQYGLLDAELRETRVVLEEVKSKVAAAEKQLENQEKEHSKELNNLVIQRESTETLIEKIRDEKQSVDAELRILREQLSVKSSAWTREEKQLTTELKHTKDALIDMEKTRNIEHNDTITALRKEKSELLNERQSLRDDVRRLHAESSDHERKWSSEKADMIVKMGERNKLVDDKMAYCKKLEGNIKTLKAQLANQGDNYIPTNKFQETIPTVDVQELKSQLERQELFFRAEKASIEDLYENKMRLLHEELNILKDRATSLKGENVMQKELLNDSNRVLADMRNKHDMESSNWNEERTSTNRRLRQLMDKAITLSKIERTLDEVRKQLSEEKTLAIHNVTESATKEAGWDVERAKLQSQIRKLEEPSLQSRFKFMEKKDTVLEKETKKAHLEAEKRNKDLKQQIRAIRADQEHDRKELKTRLDAVRTDSDKDQEVIKDYVKKLEERTKQVNNLQTALADNQYRLNTDKEAWLRERGELQRQLTESRNNHLMDQQKVTDLLAQTRKLQVLSTPYDTDRLDREATPNSVLSDNPSEKRHVVATSIELAQPTGVRSMSRQSSVDSTLQEYDQIPLDPHFQEALQHILQLADELKSTEPKIEKQMSSLAPPNFRRSLSTSEVELTQEWSGYAEPLVYATREGPTYSTMPKTSLSTVSSHGSTGATSPSSVDDDVIQPVIATEAHSSRARPVMRRSFSSSVEPNISLAVSTSMSTITTTSQAGTSLQYGRQSRQNTMTRSSIYASGTQSAYGSRDASPDKYFKFKKLSPYPQPPPSFMVTPPKTPRGTKTAPQLLTSENMAKLYEKLGAIERQDEEEETHTSPVKPISPHSKTPTTPTSMKNFMINKAKKPLRFLSKSKSVDQTEDSSMWLSVNNRSREEGLNTSFDNLDGSSQGSYEPQDYTDSYRKPKMTEPSPNTVRRNFYDDYTTRRSVTEINSITDDESVKTQTVTEVKVHKGKKTKKETKKEIKITKQKQTPVNSASPNDTSSPKPLSVKNNDKDGNKNKSSVTPFWLSSVREKRKLFTGKKSNSVDASSTQSTIAQIGAKVLSGVAAPSTYDPEGESSTKPDPESRRKFFHKRALSMDASMMTKLEPTGTVSTNPAFFDTNSSLRHSGKR